MKAVELRRLRLVAQGIGLPEENAGAVVRKLGAMQAQDYLASLWAVGLRVKGATEADIEQAVRDREIVRTWPMRGTLHFVAPEDVRWMLALLSPRIVASAATRHRQLGLDEAVFSRSRKLLEKTLRSGRLLTRDAAYELLERAGISCTGQRGYHILWKLAQDAVLCCGPREGKQPTFTLLDEWVPESRSLGGDEALAEIARRYFTSHGPATLADFVWWTGLKITDAKKALELVAGDLEKVESEGDNYWMSRSLSRVKPSKQGIHLLPGFDEFLLGYKDRSAVLDPEHAGRIVPGNNGMFMPMLVIDGKVAGTWKRTLGRKSVTVAFEPFSSLTAGESKTAARNAAAYAEFLGLELTMS
ncbi:AlkZ family DNA glycosylase [Luteolibacter ambystomatis]|uniref:AlkZ family DNA glycosylase n=1 Tax=Luteolibacter ambystomatis TaxID=2824561 RepID=A0A975IYI9_9BACT|nr:winged helix DNA-binding domain-containing protein [Luteolibacter ambystomatis]QUE50282.1 AlkZ family DNA glycosylase [Luteolibacter ambystomatis]